MSQKGAIILFIRLSRDEDKEQIKGLLMLCFGDRSHYDCLENLNGRYLLAFESDNLIGMTGLNYNAQKKRYEVDWTGTHPEYQGKGVMHELFKRICALTDEDIYCSCWRHQGSSRINLYSLMRDFGFREVIKSALTHNCISDNSYCVAQKVVDGKREHCRYYEDLYLREKKGG